jgi:photosystem II stability/assembly factor-like uncharacterized protein
MKLALAALLLALAATGSSAQDTISGPWVMQSSGTTASFRGIHAVGGGVAWASGTGGTVLRTEDSGYMWQSCSMPPGAEKLDFRGIWAWDADTAVVMSSGTGDLSRVYKTTDGCSHWTLMFTNPDKDGFWDAMVFWDIQHGEIFGDPVMRQKIEPMEISGSNGSTPALSTEVGGKPTPPTPEKPVETRFAVFFTSDAGKTWSQDDGAFFRADPKRAGAFAASNSSVVRVSGRGWFGIGGLDGSFIYRGVSGTDILSRDGLYWGRVTVPLSKGTAASGVFSLAAKDAQHLLAVGGDYTKPNESAGTAAWSADGGNTWTAAEKPPHGYRSAVAWDADAKAWIASGPNGSDISYDDGKTWSSLDDGNWNALSLPWVVGPKGRIAKLDEGRLKKN